MVDDYAARLKTAMDRAGVKIPALAKAIGISYQAVRKVLRGEGSNSFTAENNLKASMFLVVSPKWLATGEGAMDELVIDGQHRLFSVLKGVNLDSVIISPVLGGFTVVQSDEAHPMSLESAETVPSITRDQLMTNRVQLPAVFRMPIENEEMAPRVRPGAWVQFSAALARDARPGDGVLVRDSDGRIHFRTYRAGRAGAWEAHAVNENYQPLSSDMDGLEVIAVLTAVEGRWS